MIGSAMGFIFGKIVTNEPWILLKILRAKNKSLSQQYLAQ